MYNIGSYIEYYKVSINPTIHIIDGSEREIFFDKSYNDDEKDSMCVYR